MVNNDAENGMMGEADENDSMLTRKPRVYSYDKALRTTINKKYKKDEKLGCCSKYTLTIFGGASLQVLFVIATCLQAGLGSFIQMGQAFLEKVPPSFQCLHDDDGEWHQCTKKEICAQGIPRDHYRPDTSEPQYIDNWVEQYDLVCEPKWKIGLLGSVYFSGVLSCVVLVPWLADKYGRRWNAFINYAAFIVIVCGILLASDLMTLYVLLFLAGATFGGRAIVNFMYVVEYIHARRKQLVVFLKLLWGSAVIVLFTAEFQFVTKNYRIIAIQFLALCILGTVYIILVVPESPVFYFNEERYPDSREALKATANFNQVYRVRDRPYEDFKFIREEHGTVANAAQLESESSKELTEQQTDQQSRVEEYIQLQDEYLADRKYAWDVVRLATMWTSASFCLYTLAYLNKYLSGSIFINYYFDGVAGVTGYLLGKPLYSYCKMKVSFLLALSVAFVGSLGIYMFEAGIISPYFIDDLGCPDSGYEPESPQDREYHLARVIPVFTFTAKIGNYLLFYCAYQASYTDPRIFPSAKRSTAIGICNFVARFCTIFAPLVAELDKPIPTLITTIVTEIALLVALTFPSEAQLKREAEQILIDNNMQLEEMMKRDEQRNEQN